MINIGCLEVACMNDVHCDHCARCSEHCWKMPNACVYMNAPKERVRKDCYSCHRQLCSELDSYYERDDYWNKFCAECRHQRLKR